ncbi:MAG: DUF3048 domain-containing protein [Lachnospiraceae bacterium]|nr:DUF3048 domain-containing protein [Lachnospiraceae bacterium]
MKNWKRIASAILVGALSFSMVACGNKAEEEAPAEELTEDVEANSPEVLEDTGFYSVLTGLPVETEEETMLRPVAIMTENTKVALPQYGLNQAGVLYECPVEGGITRMMAIYDQKTAFALKQIGNVRSCRPYYAFIASEYDAIYVHFGQSIQGLTLLETGIVDNLSGLDGSVSETVFFRSSDKSAPHNAYASGEGIEKGMEKKGYRSTYNEGYNGYFKFAKEENKLENGKDCAVIEPYFLDNSPYFIYNEDTGLYERYEFGKPQVDAIDGEQVAVKNVIFKNCPSSIYDGTQYLNIPVDGSGEGKYFTTGKMIDITWEKETESAVTHYFDASGNEIEINPGQTWVCVIENQYAEDNNFYATVDEFKKN